MTCPHCQRGTLLAVRSCVQGYCLCDECGLRFLLSELAPLLSEEGFERLAEAVGDHLSDRV